MPIPTTTRHKVIGLLSAGFVILIANVIFSIWVGDRTSRFAALTVSDQQLKAALTGVLSAAQDAETGQRGYLLTGEENYLAPYVSALTDMPTHMGELDRLSGQHQGLHDKLPELKELAQRRLTIIESSIVKMRSGDREAAMQVVKDGLGKTTMDNLRRLVGDLTRSQDIQIVAGLDNLSQSEQWSRFINLATLALLAGVTLTTAGVVYRFVTDLEATQTELQRVNAGLERIVEERTGEVMRANEEIQRFAYIVSHDLRAPLVNIMGFTSELEAIGKMVDQQYETLKEKGSDLLLPDTGAAVKVELPEAISFIRTSTAKMDRLINAILGLSREGRRVLSATQVDMSTLVGDIAKSLRHQIDERGGEIAVGTLPTIVTDKLAIEQVFSNVIENAVKYIDAARAPKIEVSGRSEGFQATYTVTDNGRGIEEKDLERIFELFRRAGRQDTAGEGLGLAFVRASVRRLGGTIAVRSEVGTGTTFTLKFPLRLQLSRRNNDG